MKKQATLFPEKERPILPELNLTEAQTLSEQIKSAVALCCDQIAVAGSIRRRRQVVHDIDFVVVAKSDTEWQRINDELKRMNAKPNCQGNAVIKAYLPCKDGLFQVDFYRAEPSTFGIHLLIRTGSAEHNMWLAAQAFAKGMRLKYSQGLLKEGTAVAGAEETGVFAALGLPCPEPADREIVEDRPIWQRKKEQEYEKIWHDTAKSQQG